MHPASGTRRRGTSDAGTFREEVTGMETGACTQHDGDHGHIHAEETCGHESLRHGDIEHEGIGTPSTATTGTSTPDPRGQPRRLKG